LKNNDDDDVSDFIIKLGPHNCKEEIIVAIIIGLLI